MQPDEYRKMAEVEDAMWYYRALHAHVGRELARELPAGGARVLDAGCGTGGLLRALHHAQPASSTRAPPAGNSRASSRPTCACSAR